MGQWPGPGSVVPESTAVGITIAVDTAREIADLPAGQLTLEDIAAYPEVVFEDGDPALLARALDALAQSRGLRKRHWLLAASGRPSVIARWLLP
jgi:hypothetical protein